MGTFTPILLHEISHWRIFFWKNLKPFRFRLKWDKYNVRVPRRPEQTSAHIISCQERKKALTFSSPSTDTNSKTNQILTSDCIGKRILFILNIHLKYGRSQWQHHLRRTSATARLLGLWVRTPPEVRISVSCECCVLSVRGLCHRMVTRPDESYRMWCVVVCDLETSRQRRLWPA